ncbi:MAG: rhodanese-like domain-containing protein [bacterium]|jgi:rhodanese-related sulfurtransferase
MIWLKKIVFQTIVLLILGSGIGLALNALSSEPLPLIRPSAPPVEEEYTVLSTEDVNQMLNAGEAIFIDARDPNEYAVGHIPGALNLPANSFAETYAEIGDALPRDFPLVIYCQGGACDQSHEVLEQLEQLDFQMLFLYQEGWNAWSEAGLPVEQ